MNCPYAKRPEGMNEILDKFSFDIEIDHPISLATLTTCIDRLSELCNDCGHDALKEGCDDCCDVFAALIDLRKVWKHSIAEIEALK